MPVARSCTLLYRRFAIGRASKHSSALELSATRRMQFFDSAECNSALLRASGQALRGNRYEISGLVVHDHLIGRSRTKELMGPYAQRKRDFRYSCRHVGLQLTRPQPQVHGAFDCDLAPANRLHLQVSFGPGNP
jgi:hypothetical protein